MSDILQFVGVTSAQTSVQTNECLECVAFGSNLGYSPGFRFLALADKLKCVGLFKFVGVTSVQTNECLECVAFGSNLGYSPGFRFLALADKLKYVGHSLADKLKYVGHSLPTN